MSGLIDPFLTVSQLSISVTFQETSRKCPPTWDGWQCWPQGGSPGQIEFRPCPSYIYFHSERNQNVDPCGSKSQHTEGRLNLNFQAHPYGLAFLNP